MTQDDIIRMAREAGFADDKGVVHAAYQLEAFANLVAAAELVQPVQEPVARVAEVHMSRYTLEWTNGPLPEGTELFSAQPPLPVQEPVAYDKTEMNSFVIDLYDLKMREGKHGHYEALFHCVHQAIKRAAHGIGAKP